MQVGIIARIAEQDWRNKMDSDFTVGFKQGQEHGKQIAQEKMEDILDKIRAEIRELATFDTVDVLVEVDRIIDKYKAECEGNK